MRCPAGASCCESFIYGNIDTGQAGLIHSDKGKQVSPVINDRNIHVDSDFPGFGLSALEDCPGIA
jgi:hypothetical protein